MVAAQRHQLLLPLVEEVRADHVGAEGQRDLLCHLPHPVDDGAGSREDLADAHERRRLAEALLGLGVQPGVLQRQHELTRDRQREVHLRRLEGGRPLAVVERHHADDLVLPDHRHDEVRLETEGLEPLARHEVARARVVHDDRAPRLAGARVRRDLEARLRGRRLEGGPLVGDLPSVRVL